ncbi:uncharacterized protein [Battus philenor]|uniref:uncharacterized protein n=1 Tax=Battus philenor TaxID=42288 RepID=UPI0035D133B9
MRWAVRGLKKDAVIQSSTIQAWVAPTELMEVDGRASWFQKAMTQICNASTPTAKPKLPGRQVYWWNQENATLKRECLKARRRYTGHCRRRPHDAGSEDELYSAHREKKKSLQDLIKESKIRSREQLLETLNSDTWGRPYGAVRNVIRPWTPPVTETL